MHKTFWMVVGQGVPTFRHDTMESARTEAERLARLCRSETFFIVESIAGVKATDVIWKPCDEQADLPF